MSYASLEREYLEPPAPVEADPFDVWVSDWMNVMTAVSQASHVKADALIRAAQDEDATEAGNQLLDILRGWYEESK